MIQEQKEEPSLLSTQSERERKREREQFNVAIGGDVAILKV